MSNEITCTGLLSCQLPHFESGWWFQTFFIFHNIWDNPSHWLIFFKMVKNHQAECLDGTVPISDGKTTKPGPEVKTCASETQQGFPSDHQILHLGLCRMMDIFPSKNGPNSRGNRGGCSGLGPWFTHILRDHPLEAVESSILSSGQKNH